MAALIVTSKIIQLNGRRDKGKKPVQPEHSFRIIALLASRQYTSGTKGDVIIYGKRNYFKKLFALGFFLNS